MLRTESILGLDPHIQAAVIFGRGRFQIGVLVEPAPQYSFDPRDTDRLRAFTELIWFVILCYWSLYLPSEYESCNDLRPSVRRMNEDAPQHARLFKEVCLNCYS